LINSFRLLELPERLSGSFLKKTLSIYSFGLGLLRILKLWSNSLWMPLDLIKTKLKIFAESYYLVQQNTFWESFQLITLFSRCMIFYWDFKSHNQYFPVSQVLNHDIMLSSN